MLRLRRSMPVRGATIGPLLLCILALGFGLGAVTPDRAAAAAAAPAWQQTRVATTGTPCDTAVDGAGTAWASWLTQTGAKGKRKLVTTSAYLAYRLKGGAWAKPRRIWTTRERLAGFELARRSLSCPLLVAGAPSDPAGADAATSVDAIWLVTRRAKAGLIRARGDVVVQSFGPGGALGKARTTFRNVGDTTWGYDRDRMLATNARGEALYLYRDRLLARSASGVWTSTRSESDVASIALADDGTAVLAGRTPDSKDDAVGVQTRNAAGVWSAQVPVHAGSCGPGHYTIDRSQIQAAAAVGGVAAVSWPCLESGGGEGAPRPHRAFFSRLDPATGAWSPAALIDDDPDIAGGQGNATFGRESAGLTVDPAGAVRAYWLRSTVDPRPESTLDDLENALNDEGPFGDGPSTRPVAVRVTGSAGPGAPWALIPTTGPGGLLGIGGYGTRWLPTGPAAGGATGAAAGPATGVMFANANGPGFSSTRRAASVLGADGTWSPWQVLPSRGSKAFKARASAVQSAARAGVASFVAGPGRVRTLREDRSARGREVWLGAIEPG